MKGSPGGRGWETQLSRGTYYTRSLVTCLLKTPALLQLFCAQETSPGLESCRFITMSASVVGAAANIGVEGLSRLSRAPKLLGDKEEQDIEDLGSLKY